MFLSSPLRRLDLGGGGMCELSGTTFYPHTVSALHHR